jgi:hypothetical protein
MMRRHRPRTKIGLRTRSQRGLVVADPVDRPVLPLPSAQPAALPIRPGCRLRGPAGRRPGADGERGTLRVLDAIFVHGDAETGELEAIAVHGDGAGRIVAPLLEFRLDPVRRRRATERALGGDRAAVVRSLGAKLEKGESLAAVLVEHVWAIALEDAVARTGGTPVASEFIDVTSLAELSIEDAASADG